MAELADQLSGGRGRGPEAMQRRLVAAILRGQLLSHTGPKTLLRSVHKTQPHPGVQIGGIRPIDEIVRHADGIAVYKTTYIAWTCDDVDDKAKTEAAVDALCNVELSDYSDAMRVGLLSLKIAREEYRDFCELTARPLPAFWFEKPHRLPRERAARGCQQWLINLVALNGARPAPRQQIFEKAKSLFKGLTKDGFGQCWRESPESWRSGGAPSNPQNPIWPTGRFGSFIVES